MNIQRYIVRLATLVGVAFLAYVPAAYAGQTSTSFHVRTTVAGTCSASASDLNFGAYEGQALWNQKTYLTVNCTKDEDVHVELGYSGNSLGTQRRMESENVPGNYLMYSLNKSTGCSSNWGTGGDDMEITGTGVNEQLTVYGCMPAQNAGVQGVYSDTVLVTLNY
jgi:spore coat protein U-like protein